MSRLKSRTTGAMTLFPFLAVLICAMGALIFLLIVFTRQMREQAVKQAIDQSIVAVEEISPEEEQVEPLLIIEDESVPESNESLEPEEEIFEEPETLPIQKEKIVLIDPNIELRKQLEKLENIKKQTLKNWEKNQQKLSEEQAKSEQAEKKIASILKEVEQLEIQEELFDGKTKRISEELKYASFAEKKIKKKILKSKQKLYQVKNQYAFVPYDGKSGTTRRPLLVECTASSVRILPEEIEFSSEDFKGYPQNYNPVLVVLDALVEYWSTQSENYEKPYVLIIVRPGGGAAYYTTRKYITNLKADVGYELVEENWELALPEVNPDAKMVAMKALESLLEKRRIYMESVVKDYQEDYTEPGLRNGRRTVKRNKALSRGLNRSGSGSAGYQNQVVQVPESGSQLRKGQPGHGSGRGPQEPGLFQDPFSPNGGQSSPSKGQATPNGGQTSLNGDKLSSNGDQFSPNRSQHSPNSDQHSPNGGQSPENGGQTSPKTDQQVAQNLGSAQGKPSNQKKSGQGKTGQKGPEGFSLDYLRDSKPESFMEHVRKRNDDRENGSINEGQSSQSPSNQDSFASTGRKSSPRSKSSSGEQNSASMPAVNINNRKNKDEESIKQMKKWGLYLPGASIGFERNIPVHFEDRIMELDGVVIDLNQIKSYAELVNILETTTEKIVYDWGYPPNSFYWIPKLKFHIYPENEKELRKLVGKLKKRELPSEIQFLDEADKPGVNE